MNATKRATARFRVGDWVSFRYGTKDLVAQVIEARGPLGFQGRHLYRVRVAEDADEPDSFEMPEEELESVSSLSKGAVIAYLKAGGLVEILRSNLGGRGDQFRVWLTYSPRGDVTHTFSAERGVVGGATVPFFALHEGKVFTPKKDEVIKFLNSFGLNRAEAQGVLAVVGTAPVGRNGS